MKSATMLFANTFRILFATKHSLGAFGFYHPRTCDFTSLEPTILPGSRILPPGANDFTCPGLRFYHLDPTILPHGTYDFTTWNYQPRTYDFTSPELEILPPATYDFTCRGPAILPPQN